MTNLVGIADPIKRIQNFTSENIDDLCMMFASQLVDEKFKNEDLADYEVKVMELTRERIIRLKGNPDTMEPVWIAGLQIEMSLYIGMLIGAVCMEKALITQKEATEDLEWKEGVE